MVKGAKYKGKRCTQSPKYGPKKGGKCIKGSQALPPDKWSPQKLSKNIIEAWDESFLVMMECLSKLDWSSSDQNIKTDFKAIIGTFQQLTQI